MRFTCAALIDREVALAAPDLRNRPDLVDAQRRQVQALVSWQLAFAFIVRIEGRLVSFIYFRAANLLRLSRVRGRVLHLDLVVCSLTVFDSNF